MSKVKVSLSLVLTMLFIGLFSAVAFAATQLPVPTGLDVTSNTTPDKAKITWTPVANATDYTVKITTVDNTGAEVVVLAPTSTTNVTSYDATGLDPEVRYVATVVAKGDGGVTYTDSVATTKGFITHNKSILVQPAGDNWLNNANQTGMGNVNKATQGQHTHGDYKNNTNSCASCHQTHTAAGGKLLFKSSDYDACMACHDGTLGYYNIFETDNTKDLGAGTFGGTHGGNMSVHLANGTLEIGAAPGSNTSIVSTDPTKPTWTAEFSCSSCHDPHGSYSKRLLTSNPNSMADVDRTADINQGLWYGNKLNDVSVIDGSALADKAARDAAILAWGQGSYTTNATTAAKAMKFQVSAADVTTGGTYVGLGLNSGDWIIQLYRWNDSAASKAWVPTPYLQNGGNSGDGIEIASATEATAGADLDGTAFGTVSTASVKGQWKAAVSNGKAAAQPGWIVNGAKGFLKIGPLYSTTDTAYGKISTTTFGGSTNFYPIGALIGAEGGTKLTTADSASFTAAFNTACGQTAAMINYLTNVRTVQVTDIPLVGTGVFMPNGVEVMKTTLTSLVNTNVANGYNYFCATCHVDYLSAKGASAIATANSMTGVGTGSQKYIHHTMSSSYTCARCHFAHGTDVDWMRDASGRTVTDLVNAGVYADKASAEAYMLDVNPSSALKRYTNMTVCYGCHTSSHAEVIVNDGTFGTTADSPNGINVDGTTSFFNNNIAVPKVTGTH